MQIVIEIPEKYKDLLDKGEADGSIRKSILLAVSNGISLPKGHGDLKDMGNLQYVFDLTREDPIYSGKDIERTIKLMKTIIEADKESKDAVSN